mmetsp:Transcript_9150/g.37714  ORF Transcript_9150/g.37714 Transcript_9150/m.37714 type:complete len:332 (+) Transcript_9150:38-1033(+)
MCGSASLSRHAARLWRVVRHEEEDASSGRYARTQLWRNEVCKEIADFIATCPNADSLTLNRALIANEGWEALAEGVEKCGSVEELRLRAVSLVEGPCAMLGALQTNTSVQHLYLAGLSVGEAGGDDMALCLGDSKSLKTIRIRGPTSDDGDTSVLCRSIGVALSKSATIAVLHIEPTLEGAINGVGCTELARGLALNRSLAHLALSNNQIGPSGAAALAVALMSNDTLTHLDLGGNDIGDEGCVALSVYIAKTTSLQRLALDRNRVACNGCEDLVDALLESCSLTALDLFGNEIGTRGWAAIAGLLNDGASLTELNLAMNSIDVADDNSNY